MRGRKPKPTARKRLEGNPGRRPLNEAEPALPPIAPAADPDAPPPELDGLERAQREWRRLAPMLREARQITEGDRSALLAVCIEWARYVDTMRQIQQTGLLVKTPNGYPIANPLIAIATRALAACNKLWPELGLTPSSRSRVKRTEPETPGGEFAEFLEPEAITH